MPEPRTCRRCGARNPGDAAYCYLCQEPIPEDAPAPPPGRPAEGRAVPSETGVQRLAGPSAGGPRGAVRAIPMLLFTDAERHNVRMSIALFTLLLAVFFLLGAAIGGSYGSAGKGLALAAILYAILGGAAYFSGSDIVLSIHDAAAADPDRHRQLLNVVEEMAIAAGLPVPKVYVMPCDGLNAFAAGRAPREASVAVTQGLLERLSREELQGVVAHELAHVKSRDTLYNISAAVLVGAVALLSDMFLRGTLFGRGGRSSGGGRDGDGRANAALLVLGLLLALLAPLAAKILQMSISRQREYHADAAAAGFTRNPLGLASALSKISASGAQVPGENRGTQHLFIVNPLRDFGLDATALMSTHPPTKLRIQRLNAMAGFGGEG
jgi:heat shock protein HtpX